MRISYFVYCARIRARAFCCSLSSWSCARAALAARHNKTAKAAGRANLPAALQKTNMWAPGQSFIFRHCDDTVGPACCQRDARRRQDEEASAWRVHGGAMRPARRNPALRKDRMARWSHGEGSTWIFVTLAPLNSSSAESPDHFCADTLLAAQLRREAIDARKSSRALPCPASHHHFRRQGAIERSRLERSPAQAGRASRRSAKRVRCHSRRAARWWRPALFWTCARFRQCVSGALFQQSRRSRCASV